MPPDIRTFPIVVPRTARVAAFGPPPAEAAEWWVVLHGYGQLAEDFLAGCRALDDGRRLVLAPEALNRFYDQPSSASHAEAKVGATWMTREDRENEIADYVAYLDRLLDVVGEGMAARPPVHVLGFSQGTATASRWVARGRAGAARLIVWGGGIAPDVDITSPDTAIRQARVQLVTGTRDQWATPARVADEQARLAAASLPHESITFEGGHRLDDATLRRLADG